MFEVDAGVIVLHVGSILGAHDGGRAKMLESGVIGHALCATIGSHVFKAKKGGGLDIVESKQNKG